MAGRSLAAVVAASLCLLATAAPGPAGDEAPARALRGTAGGASRRPRGGRPAGAPAGVLADRPGFPSEWPFLRRCLDPRSAGGLLNHSLPACPAGGRSDFATGARVAVVGGGPAGTSMAKLLHDRGFVHVTLLEASDRLGGKSQSVNVNGEAHELGTCYASGKYECIELWARSVGMTEVGIDGWGRLISSDKAVLYNMTAPAFGGMLEYMTDYSFRHYGIPPDSYVVELYAAADAYNAHWAATMGGSGYMFPSDPSQVDLSALNQTFESWLAERNLTALAPFVNVAMNAQGYGSADKVPALYGLMWIHPNFVHAASSGFVAVFKEGYQTLWERIIATTGVEVRLNAKVGQIRRQGSAVVVQFEEGREEAFDWLVMAAPMPQALALMADASDEERDLFGSYNFHELSVSLWNQSSTGVLPSDYKLFSFADRWPEMSKYYRMSDVGGRMVREMYDAAGDGGPFTFRNDANIAAPSSSVAVAYQISDFSSTDAAVAAAVVRGASGYGLTLNLLRQKRWDYMPFYTLEEVVRERKPWRVWDLQGKRRTWWVGSHVSFESVADVLDYNLQLVNSRLCA